MYVEGGGDCPGKRRSREIFSGGGPMGNRGDRLDDIAIQPADGGKSRIASVPVRVFVVKFIPPNLSSHPFPPQASRGESGSG